MKLWLSTRATLWCTCQRSLSVAGRVRSTDLELLAIDGLSAGADAVREVATLVHVAELIPGYVIRVCWQDLHCDRAQRRGPD